jgi:hypothetical protein
MAAESQSARGPTHPPIESSRIQGTRVYGQGGQPIGTIDYLVIEKVSGRVVYAVMSFGGLLGVGAHVYTVPWDKLNYDARLGGYHTDITQRELQDAPHLPHDSDRQHEEEVMRYCNVPPYWM